MRRHGLAAAAFCVTVALAAAMLAAGGATAVGAEISWHEHDGNPVYDPADHRAYYPCVLYDPDGFSGHGATFHYKMWYGGYESAPGSAHNQAVTYSDDGIDWSAPVEMQGIAAGGYHAQVVYIPEGFGAGPYFYKIWYWTGDMDYTIGNMRTADSADGENWENDQAVTQDAAYPLISGISGTDWKRGTYGPVSVLYNPSASNTGDDPFDHTFAMYYDATTGGQEVIGLAYSADGAHWTRYHLPPYEDAPVFDHGSPGDWDSDYATFGTVIPDIDGTWHLWYSGSGPAGFANQGIGHATSPDGINWTRDPENPLFHRDDGVAWRNVRTYTPSVLYSPDAFRGHGENARFKMWFSGRTNTPSTNYSVGYASSREPVLALEKSSQPTGQVKPGDELTYTMVVRNGGNAPATGTTLRDAVPAHTSYVAGSTTINGAPVPDSGGTTPLQAGMSVNSPGDPPGTIAPGGLATVTFKARVMSGTPGGTRVTNAAAATCSEQPSGVTAQAVIEVAASAPSLVLEKTSFPAREVTRGSVIRYTLRARNVGDAAATGARLTDAVPAHTGYVSHTTTLNGIRVEDAGGTTPLAGGMAVNSPGEVPGVIAPGAEAVVTFMVQVANDLPLGADVRNVAVAEADGLAPVEASCANASSAGLPKTWFFAEGSTQPGFDEYILMSNMGDDNMNVTITYLTEDGAERDSVHLLPARSRRTVYVNAEMPGENGVAAIVRGEEGFVCERSMYFMHRGIPGGDDVMGVAAPSLELFFAEGFTGTADSPFEEWLLLLNPNLEEARVEVAYLFPEGEEKRVEYRVPPRRRLTISVDAEVGEGREVSALLRSDLPLVAERAMYFSYNNRWAGGHNGVAATAASGDWYLAEGYTGWEGSPFDEWILVANRNEAAAAVTVTYMFPDGSTRAFDHTAPPRGRMTVSVDADLGEGQMVSAHVHSDLPVVVERAMYFSYRGAWAGGHNCLGATAPASRLYFAEGYTGNPGSRFETWLLVQNTSREPKAARVDYVLSTGEVVTQVLELPPLSRTTVLANQLLERESLEFSMLVTSSDGSSSLLAERAMYFDYSGSFGPCQGGSDVVGY
ncbi:MAG: DUF11 domain-containing protein [Actinobacteria bacterium]|nr:DUF11 domain-containing protein [Actinomycetota bacterium]